MTDRIVNISMCVTCPYFVDDDEGKDCLYCEMHFDDSFEGNSIPDWCELQKADTLPSWAIEEINERIEMVESNQKQLESNGDTSDDISRLQCMKMAYETGLSLRKPEDATK